MLLTLPVLRMLGFTRLDIQIIPLLLVRFEPETTKNGKNSKNNN